jgi:hypothetical protein
MTNTALSITSSSHLHWLISGCVGALLTSASSFRLLARRFDWGPSDT